MEEPDRTTRSRRVPAWLVAAIVLAVIGGLVFVLSRDGSGSDADTACRAVVRAVRESNDGKRSADSLLEVVRTQAPVARAAAQKEPTAEPIAGAIDEMRANMEAGRPWPSVVVLYQRCG